jgi:hypothetical protein
VVQQLVELKRIARGGVALLAMEADIREAECG